MIFDNWIISGCVKLRMLDNKTSSFDVIGNIPDGWEWQLLYTCNGNLNIVNMEQNENTLHVLLTKEMLPMEGTYHFQIKATKGELVKHTNIVKFYVNKSLSGDIQWPVIPTEFTDFEQVIKSYAESAKESAEKAQDAVIHAPLIGENGNWFVWNYETSKYFDTGVSASGSTDAVLYTEQELNDSQKGQARNNIGAINMHNGVFQCYSWNDPNHLSDIIAGLNSGANICVVSHTAPIPVPVTVIYGGVERGTCNITAIAFDGSVYTALVDLMKSTTTNPVLVEQGDLYLIKMIKADDYTEENKKFVIDTSNDVTFSSILKAYNSGKKVQLDISVLYGKNVGIEYPKYAQCEASHNDEILFIINDLVNLNEFETINSLFAFFSGFLVKDDLSVNILGGVEPIKKYLPQMFVVNVSKNSKGNLQAENTLEQIIGVLINYGYSGEVYEGSGIVSCLYEDKLYYISAGTSTSMTFTATTENGLETLTVSNDGKEGSADVWTHEVTSIDNKVVVTLTYQNGKYTPSISAKTIYRASKAGKNVVLKDPDNSSEIPLAYSTSYDVGIATFSSVNQMSSISQRIESPYVSTWEIRGETVATRYRTPLPPVITSSDNGKFLRVVDGAWAAAEIALPVLSTDPTALIDGQAWINSVDQKFKYVVGGKKFEIAGT